MVAAACTDYTSGAQNARLDAAQPSVCSSHHHLQLSTPPRSLTINQWLPHDCTPAPVGAACKQFKHSMSSRHSMSRQTRLYPQPAGPSACLLQPARQSIEFSRRLKEHLVGVLAPGVRPAWRQQYSWRQCSLVCHQQQHSVSPSVLMGSNTPCVLISSNTPSVRSSAVSAATNMCSNSVL